MRFFVALEIPEESKEQIKAVQNLLKQIIPEVKLTDPDKLHLTIAFVGEEDSSLQNSLTQVLKISAENIPAFTVTPAYIDGFPSLHHASTFWLGVKGDLDKLMILREKIKDGLGKLGIPVDERRYVPHIAIAKASNFEITPSQEEKLQAINFSNFAEIKISSIRLFESIPQQGFHSHNTLAEIKLDSKQLDRHHLEKV